MYDPGVPCIVYRVLGLGAGAVLSVGVLYLFSPVSTRTVRVPYQAQTPQPSGGSVTSASLCFVNSVPSSTLVKRSAGLSAELMYSSRGPVGPEREPRRCCCHVVQCA